MLLSNHFRVSEFFNSNKSKSLGIKNIPDDALALDYVLDNLVRVCSVLELIRTYIDSPIRITSGYRSSLLNKAVGGAITSNHLNGCAVDFQFINPRPSKDTYDAIVNFLESKNIEFDEFFIEYKGNTFSHFHIAVRPALNRKLTKKIVY